MYFLVAEVEKNYKRIEDRLGYNQLQSVHMYTVLNLILSYTGN